MGSPWDGSPGLPQSLSEGVRAGIGEESEWVWVGQRLGGQEGKGEDEEWIPVTTLGPLVKDTKIKSLEGLRAGCRACLGFSLSLLLPLHPQPPGSLPSSYPVSLNNNNNKGCSFSRQNLTRHKEKISPEKEIEDVQPFGCGRARKSTFHYAKQ